MTLEADGRGGGEGSTSKSPESQEILSDVDWSRNGWLNILGKELEVSNRIRKNETYLAVVVKSKYI